MPLWLWCVIGYLSVLFTAALWAAVERSRSKILERTRRLSEPETGPEALLPVSETS
jgi:hypothetical protein